MESRNAHRQRLVIFLQVKLFVKSSFKFSKNIYNDTLFEIDAQLNGLYNANKMIRIMTTYID